MLLITGNKLYYTMNLLQQEIIEYEFTQQEIIKLKKYYNRYHSNR